MNFFWKVNEEDKIKKFISLQIQFLSRKMTRWDDEVKAKKDEKLWVEKKRKKRQLLVATLNSKNQLNLFEINLFSFECSSASSLCID